MMSPTDSVIYVITVSLLWGFTNPLMKRASSGIEQVAASHWITQLLGEIKFMLCNWKYLIPFLINQSGSFLYYVALGSMELSVAVPITNSLTFLFTTIAGHILGEKTGSNTSYVGMVFVLTGVTICSVDKMWFGQSNQRA